MQLWEDSRLRDEREERNSVGELWWLLYFGKVRDSLGRRDCQAIDLTWPPI